MIVAKGFATPMVAPHLPQQPNLTAPQTKTAQLAKSVCQALVKMAVVQMQNVLVVKFVAKTNVAKAAKQTTTAPLANSVSKVDAKTTLAAQTLTAKLEQSVRPQELLV